jgi:UDP-N-acetyl-D-mannosaminuronate dehydrogenase
MKQLIIGMGEVGKALSQLLEKNVATMDLEPVDGKFNVVHICFPYTKAFIGSVEAYVKRYEPKLLIIHSSVPVGTTDRFGDIAVHSPVRGVHPNILEGLKTFDKYFGGKQAKKASNLFKGLCPTVCVKSARDTEMAKLLDTTYYGWNIIFNKKVKHLCEEYNLDFDTVYTKFNESYNEGYAKLGMGHVRRPVLKYMEGKCGGHCIRPNVVLLDDKFFNVIKKYE